MLRDTSTYNGVYLGQCFPDGRVHTGYIMTYSSTAVAENKTYAYFLYLASWHGLAYCGTYRTDYNSAHGRSVRCVKNY
jgi:hypothetical protein